jgi:hypothetical protein
MDLKEQIIQEYLTQGIGCRADEAMSPATLPILLSCLQVFD